MTWRPAAVAAVCISFADASVCRLVGLTNTAIRVTCGSISERNPSRFPSITPVNTLMPVILPPGRFKLSTRPSLTGSALVVNTTGTVVVAAFAASDATGPIAAITRLNAYSPVGAMSALGQKQTFAAQKVMSALPQKRTCAVQLGMSALCQ